MKKGFTLAEVLLTLAIIGVVATVTLPTLNTNIQKQQASPGLVKGMNNIQQATAMMLRDQHARSLSHIRIATNGAGDLGVTGNGTSPCTAETYLRCITQQDGTNRISGVRLTDLGTIGTGIVANVSYRSFSGAAYNGVPNTSHVFTSKDGIAYVYVTEVPANNSVASVYIVDTNGANKGPNIIGKDSFFVAVSRRGDVIPYGSQEWVSFPNSDGYSWRTSCANNSTPTAPGGGVINVAGATCAGAIIDNSTQVKYHF